MADRIPLAAKRRDVLGKHVRHIRREGRLPANVFGKGLDSIAIEVDARDFGRTLKAHGSRHLFDLTIGEEAAPRPVVVRHISRKGGTGDPIHVDFYQVDPRTPIQTTVAIHLVGVAPAVRDLAGTLTHGLETLHVRCLPLSIPDAIEADLSGLVSFEAAVHVSDLKPPEGVEILNDPALVVVTVAPPRLLVATEDEVES